RRGGFQQPIGHEPADLQVQQRRLPTRTDLRGAITPDTQLGGWLTGPNLTAQVALHPRLAGPVAAEAAGSVTTHDQMDNTDDGDGRPFDNVPSDDEFALPGRLDRRAHVAVHHDRTPVRHPNVRKNIALDDDERAFGEGERRHYPSQDPHVLPPSAVQFAG